MTVTSKLHTQEYRDTELNIVIDEIGPGEGRLDSWGIEGPFNPAGEGGVAQVRAVQTSHAVAKKKNGPSEIPRNSIMFNGAMRRRAGPCRATQKLT